MRTARNTTISPIFIDDIGITILAGEIFEIPPATFYIWAMSVDIDQFLNSGDIELSLLGVAVSSVDALKVIHEVSPFVILKEQGGASTTVQVTKQIEVDGSAVVLTDLGNSRAKLQIDAFGGGDKRLLFAECHPVDQSCIIEAYPIMDSAPCFLNAMEC